LVEGNPISARYGYLSLTGSFSEKEETGFQESHSGLDFTVWESPDSIIESNYSRKCTD
jgi:hypothetical protein